MKRYFLLTSVLALAACGGGAGIVAPVGYNGSARVSDTAIASNSSITNMKSEVVVASNSSAPVITRSATTHSGGVTYTSYRLDDVKLRFADISVPEDAYLKIGMDDNGRIDKMTVVMGKDGDGNPIGGDLARVSDNNARFAGPIFEYVKDKYAKVGNNTFEIANTVDALKSELVSKWGWTASGEGSGWKIVNSEWKYDTDGSGHYATYRDYEANVDKEFSVSAESTAATTAGLQDAVKYAYGFADGKWENANSKYKYIEYGDDAEYRVAATDAVNKDTLDGIVEDNNLSELGHWNLVNEKMDVVSLGKNIGNNQSLQYSDFGHFNPVYSEKLVDLGEKTDNVWASADIKTNTEAKQNAELAGKDYQLFAGGYAIKGINMVDSLDVPVPTGETDTKFKGKAIGRVYVSIQSNGLDRKSYLEEWDVPYDSGNSGYTNDAGHDMANDYTTTNAELVVKSDGKQVLSMPFDGFYTVNVTKNGNVNTFEFSDTGNVMTDSQYRRNDSEGTPTQAFKPGYYGVNTASEAAGTVYYKTKQDIGENTDAGKISREWEFQAAYGMVKQPDNN